MIFNIKLSLFLPFGIIFFTLFGIAVAKIVGEIEDSVLLKRAGNFDRYLYFKNLISKLPDDEREMMRVTDFCVQNNISIGGSADVLICAFMMNEIKKQFSFAKE